MKTSKTSLLTSFSKHFPYFILLLTLGSFMCYWISQAFYYNEFGDIMSFSWIVQSDWMMHLSQVQAFSELPFVHVLQNHPLYSGEILSYPFFVNWFSGLLLSLSGDLVFSMTFPLYIGTFLFLSGIYFLAYQLTKNVWIAFFTPILFFFLAGFQVYYTVLEYSFEEWALLPDYTFDIRFLGELGFNWKSFFLTTYIPQRSFLWGMGSGALFLGVFIFLFEKVLILAKQKKEEKISISLSSSVSELAPFLLLGMGIGLMSVMHTHSFFWFFFLFLGLSLIFLRQVIVFISLGIGACITGLPFVWLLLQKQGEVSAFSLWPLSRGGYENLFENISSLDLLLQNIIHIFVYWTFNWGIVFIVGIASLFYFGGKKMFCSATTNQEKQTDIDSDIQLGSLEYSPLYIPIIVISIVLLFAFSIVQLQGNPWDNTKVHLWSGLFFALVASCVLVFFWKKSIIGKGISSLLFFVMVSSGVIMMHSGINDTPTVMLSFSNQEKAEQIALVLPANETVLTSDYFHHFFSPLLPNQIFMGYRGWIASYGMDYNSKVITAQKIYSGAPEALDLLDQENIEYVYADVSAAHEFDVEINNSFFYRYFEELIRFNDGGVLYKRIR